MDSEDFMLLIVEYYKLSSFDRKLAHCIDEIVKISSQVHKICGDCYVDSTKQIFLSLNAETGFLFFIE